MKRLLISILLSVLSPVPVGAQTELGSKLSPQDVRIVANIGGKCGFVDAKGKIVIPAIYDFASDFYADGLASVVDEKTKKSYFIDAAGQTVFSVPEGTSVADWRRDDEFIEIDNGKKMGFMNRSGKMILELKWDEVSGFRGHNLAPVKLNGAWGYIDRKGATIVPFIFSSAGSFEAGKARVEALGFSYILSEDGTLTRAPKDLVSDRIFIPESDRVSGQIYYTTDRNSTGLSTGYVKNEDEFDIVLIDKDGQKTGQLYSYIGLDNDIALYVAKQGNAYGERPTKERFGYINTMGEIVLPFIYDSAHGFDNRVSAIVEHRGKWGMIDRQGKWLIRPKFDRLGDCQEVTLRASR